MNDHDLRIAVCSQDILDTLTKHFPKNDEASLHSAWSALGLVVAMQIKNTEQAQPGSAPSHLNFFGHLIGGMTVSYRKKQQPK